MTAESIVNEFNGLGELSDNEVILKHKIQELVKSKLYEQRSICAEQVPPSFPDIEESVRNAPEPRNI